MNFGFPRSSLSTLAGMNTTAGTTIAVTIAVGTCFRASASNGGISRRAKSAMKDNRAA